MKYLVTSTVTISLHTVVEADSAEEAEAEAENRDFCALINPEQMGNNENTDWFHSGEIDGTAENIRAEPYE